MEKIRLSKLMSEQGLCSRREADSYIERGWVLVDGVPVTELGTRILPTQRITLAPAVGQLAAIDEFFLGAANDGEPPVTLVEIKPPDFDVDIDIAYATANNFTGAPVYRRAGCYLHPDTADLVRRAVDLATPLGYRLKILDAYRPSEAQWKLWEHCPNPDYIADPRRGSPHSMGAAVDLTLVDAAGGRELDMGTGFDALTPLSFHGSTEIPVEAQPHRALQIAALRALGPVRVSP